MNVSARQRFQWGRVLMVMAAALAAGDGGTRRVSGYDPDTRCRLGQHSILHQRPDRALRQGGCDRILRLVTPSASIRRPRGIPAMTGAADRAALTVRAARGRASAPAKGRAHDPRGIPGRPAGKTA